MSVNPSLQAQAIWKPKQTVSASASSAEALARHLGCPRGIADVLLARGICTPDEADAFFGATIETLLDDPATDPMGMLGMAAALDRILAAVRADETILIYGDYDVDGTTATVLLKTALERIGLAMQPSRKAHVRYHVPHRIREGYGMQKSVLAEAANSGVRLVISVDTGIRAVGEAAEARTLGLDLIVTDHHLPGDLTELPDALAVINPNQPGCSYPNKELCGAAVAFKLAQALLGAAAELTADAEAFRARTRGVLIPSFLKLVAIATVADSVALTGENRTIVALGLAGLAHPVQPGLRSLMEFSSIPLNRAPTAGEIGFRIGPRINAGGRMDVASDVVELFLTRDPQRAHELAAKLDRLNQERRDSEAQALDAIDAELMDLAGESGEYPCECLVLDHPDWHRGVLGILASRVVERTGRPALVITHADGNAHGSGRSVPGFHLLDALTAVHGAAQSADQEGTGLFARFGGHAHAVGFSMPSERMAMLRTRMRSYAGTFLRAELLVPQMEYDAEVSVSDLTPEFAAWLERCAPFGVGNPEPVFLTRGLVLSAPVRRIQDKHIGLQLRAVDGGDARTIPAMGWSRGPMDWANCTAALDLMPGVRVDVLYRIRRNTGPYAGPHFDGLEMEMRALRRCEPGGVDQSKAF